MVFGEANAFGVACLSTDVGGIPTIIQNDVNGKSFPISANSSAYSTYIEDLFANYSCYQELALSSFHQYESRLNWQTAVKNVKDLMQTLL
jgi:glycosyltransferase involved in cell wall biosynthesis